MILSGLIQEISEMEYQPEKITGDLEEECITDRYEAAAFGWRKAVEMAAEIIRNYIGDGWIPCSERLPEEPVQEGFYGLVEMDSFTEYIVMIEGAEVPTVLKYAGGGEWYSDGTFYNAIAWRLLPPPYRPDKSVGDDYKQQIMNRFIKVE